MTSEYDSFATELMTQAEGGHLTLPEVLFETYVAELDFEETTDYHYLYFEFMNQARVSGYTYNETSGTLVLFIVDSLSNFKTPTKLSLEDIAQANQYLQTFINQAAAIKRQAEASNREALDLAAAINQKNFGDDQPIRQIEKYLLTPKLADQIGEVPEHLQDMKVIDYLQYQARATDQIQSLKLAEALEVADEVTQAPIIIDRDQLGTIKALKAVETESYTAYLCTINGLKLAQLYERYGSRLIESNIRSFLQSRVKVNKGIRKTIHNDQAYFFAYNNGLTCVAKNVVFEAGEITRIEGLQIVNGGQTTASLANVLTNDKLPDALEQVTIQMKLNVIHKTDLEDTLVASISKYANSQNKVSEVDLESNKPYHKRLEQLSRAIQSPQGTYWYYERAAGQYAQETYKKTSSQVKTFKASHPKHQMFKKSDLAKYHSIRSKAPHIASKGGQTAFKTLTNYIDDNWEQLQGEMNQAYYQALITSIIAFKNLDAITKQGAGKNGYKANINAYTLSYMYWLIEDKLHQVIDYQTIWLAGQLPQSVLKFLDRASYQVRSVLTATQSNVTEYAKKQDCWEAVKDQLNLADLVEQLNPIITQK